MSKFLKQLFFTRTGMVLVSVLIPFLSFAQDEEGPPEPPGAPIDQYLLPAILILLVVVWLFYKKKTLNNSKQQIKKVEI